MLSKKTESAKSRFQEELKKRNLKSQRLFLKSYNYSFSDMMLIDDPFIWAILFFNFFYLNA